MACSNKTCTIYRQLWHTNPILGLHLGSYPATSWGFCIPGSCVCSNESSTSWTQSTNKTVIQLTLSVWGQKSPPSWPPENDLCIGFFTFSILKPSYSFKRLLWSTLHPWLQVILCDLNGSKPSRNHPVWKTSGRKKKRKPAEDTVVIHFATLTTHTFGHPHFHILKSHPPIWLIIPMRFLTNISHHPKVPGFLCKTLIRTCQKCYQHHQPHHAWTTTLIHISEVPKQWTVIINPLW